MYGHRYEDELLLSLRIMKCLHQQDPSALIKALKQEDRFDEDTMPYIAEYLIWEICQDVVVSYENLDEEVYGGEYEIQIIEFTHPAINQFGRLNCEWSSYNGCSTGAWQRKFSDAVLFFLGSCRSIGGFECLSHGAFSRIKVRTSPDCYDYLEFGNALVDLLCWLRKENERLERMLKGTENSENREEAA